MAATPWWWVPLITVIGTPLLGALLYFFVPLLRVAKYWLTHEPYWWVSQILVALLVGGAILYSGKHIDDLRATRERVAAEHQHDLDRDIAASQASHAERLENLRFVRQLSTETGTVARPFAGLDLQDQNLSGLDLKNADLKGANLQHASLVLSDLSTIPNTVLIHATNLFRANLTDADLSLAKLTDATLFHTNLTNADLSFADLTGANLTDATLVGADLTGADLTGADLTGADLKGVHCNLITMWPDGFKAPLCE